MDDGTVYYIIVTPFGEHYTDEEIIKAIEDSGKTLEEVLALLKK